jgi:hypothetical protein
VIMTTRRLHRIGLRVFRTVALVVVLASASPGRAQVCGDADGNGTVGVTDGVRLLRVAAGLDALCDASRCDLNGSGTVTVTDGVLALRKAVGLTVDERCPGGDPVADGVEALVRESLPFLSAGVGIVVEAVTPAGDDACENDPAGTIVSADDSIAFTTCLLEGVIYDGQVMFEAQGGRYVGLALTDVATERTTTANGRISFRTAGADRILTGEPSLETALGAYDCRFDDLRVAPDGTFLDGSVVLAVGGTQVEGVTTVTISFDGSDPNRAGVRADLDDGTARAFVFDFLTGDLG